MKLQFEGNRNPAEVSCGIIVSSAAGWHVCLKVSVTEPYLQILMAVNHLGSEGVLRWVILQLIWRYHVTR